jgi:hypothetical protein
MVDGLKRSSGVNKRIFATLASWQMAMKFKLVMLRELELFV